MFGSLRPLLTKPKTRAISAAGRAKTGTAHPATTVASSRAKVTTIFVMCFPLS